MIRFLSFFLLFFLFASAFFDGNVYAVNGEKMKEIQNRGTLIVGMLQADDPPFSMKDSEGNPVGIDIDLAKAMAKSLGVRVKILRSAPTYDAVVNQVVQGEVDIGISNLSITLDRAKLINYSRPYVSLKQGVLFNQKTFLKIKDKEDDSLHSIFQRGNTLGVVKGSSYVGFAKAAFPGAKLVLYDTWESLVHDMDTGNLSAGFWDRFEVEKVILLRHQGAFRYMAVVLSLSRDKVALALPKYDLHFQNWVNTFLELRSKVMAAEDLSKIYMSYLKKKRT